jgi:hypothetical protein
MKLLITAVALVAAQGGFIYGFDSGVLTIEEDSKKKKNPSLRYS